MQDSRKTTLLALAIFFVLLLFPFGLAVRSQQANVEIDAARQAAEASLWPQAAQRYANAAGRLPGRSDLWEQAGHCAVLAGDFQSALRYLAQAQQGRPVDALSSQALLDLGDAYQQSGDLAAAVDAWQQVIPRSDASSDLYQRLAQAHRSQGDYSSAIADLQKLISLQPENASLHFQLALLIVGQQPEVASEHLERAIELDPSLANPVDKIRQSILAANEAGEPAYTLLEVGRTLASLGEWNLAAEAFDQATRSRPDYAEAWAYLGEARQHLSKEDEVPGAGSQVGLEEIQKAIELEPDSLSAHLFLGLYWKRQQRYDLAEQVVRSAIQIYPEETPLWVELGAILSLAGDLNAANQAYQQAVTLAPDDLTYLTYLVNFSLYYGFQLDQVALPAARQAVALAPRDADVLVLMARVMIASGDLFSAERFLARALQADSQHAAAHLNLGVISLQRGDLAAAYPELKLAQSLDSDGSIADQVGRLLEAYYGEKAP